MCLIELSHAAKIPPREKNETNTTGILKFYKPPYGIHFQDTHFRSLLVQSIQSHQYEIALWRKSLLVQSEPPPVSGALTSVFISLPSFVTITVVVSPVLT